MPTLKEFMGYSTRGDGRKFAKESWDTNVWFEPIFLTASSCWYGMKHDGNADFFSDQADEWWHEWTPPKQTKKVKLYRPILKSRNDESYSTTQFWKKSRDSFDLESSFYKCVGWQEMEVEVKE